MKTLPTMLTCIYLTTSATFGQIDTTRKEFFPLHIGDLWQYRNQNNNLAIQQVVGDTILDGKRYFLLIHSLRTSGGGITRVDSLMRVQNRRGLQTGGDSCGGGSPYELSFYRLTEPNNSVWRICDHFWGLPTPSPLIRFNGIFRMNVFGQQRDVMRFEFGGTVPIPPDTIFGSGALLAKGIGVISEQYYDSPYYTLQGAIIDSVQYGTIVSVDDSPYTLPTLLTLKQNYPNPFNPTTTIRYEIPATTGVHLKVFNLLGEQVSVLVDEEQASGRYEVNFHTEGLASGVYFYRLIAGSQALTCKMILQK